MEKKTWGDIGCKRTDGGKLYWNLAAVVPEKSIAATLAKVEFSESVEDFMAEERATSTVDYSKPVQVIRPFKFHGLINEDLKLSSSKEEENVDDSNKENCYDDSANKENDYLKKKMNDALMKRKKIAEEEEQLLNELKRVRVRAAEIDRVSGVSGEDSNYQLLMPLKRIQALIVAIDSLEMYAMQKQLRWHQPSPMFLEV